MDKMVIVSEGVRGKAMKALKVFLEISATSISLASIFFMAFVFWNEGLRGYNVLFLEPNRPLAMTELVVACFGFVVVLGLWLKRMSQPDKKDTESYVEWVAQSEKERVA